MPQKYVKKILDARIYDLAVETPVDAAPLLSQRLNNEILLKREDLQPVFSFKLRGAYNKLRQLSKAQLEAGVIAASAGNHAQGLALAAQKMGVKATIVMPITTPKIKVDAVRGWGANVVLFGDNYDAAAGHANELIEQHGMTYIHPFDDPDIIAGQGTVGMEILRQLPGKLDAIFIAVGGGGLCAGVAAYVKYVRPGVKIIAVESDDAACLDAAMKAGKRVRLKEVGIFADGTAVAEVGKETFRILKDLVDEVITVSTDEICAAIKDVYNDTRAICEPSGAMGAAGLKKYVEQHGVVGQTLLAVQCGANIDFDRLRYISERTEVGEKREAILAVSLDEKPGSFRNFCEALGVRTISEFNYRFSDAKQAQIFVGLKVTSDEDRFQLIKDLTQQGYPVSDLTDSEIAKSHIRHMVGGRSPQVGQEQVFRFEFPERPSALLNFLIQLGDGLNISMFHYRNHGSAFGKVLVGFQASKKDGLEVKGFLDDLGYPYEDETNNEAYQFFLGS
ncbi:MAG: threonine ammonia-lyase, biosynthetic [Porticoccaceae bacterium]|jgi:threonine dehydratase|nr:threonine ammonia-lyase, biosynthetic [Porticoccaceae bacterium]MDC0053928.1 threonine ammonia-lyase, biosynthetic [Gammaproteobacteria bacterium]MBT4213106.1 threonine ammonia-lyase, biosynthetic [Porticoccaceae bacterium]MBT5070500.1 threonine ammonia-lyase, biosynthetic [Porticoccaceae bacterium]MDA8597570.1 threonine ammonia-lyase, biosynthetic [Porticoccaceae bacterium]|tara:strand:+ start:7913 stop:9427 length:1515 start_codon:yes stop_codon:yes gene_type:complete